MPYIYVMDRDGGHMKVGFSCDPHKRLPQVYGARSVLAMWQHDQAFQIEQAAHRLLADWRQDGEWFAIDRYEAANAAIGKMRDAIIAAGMMIPPLIDIDSNQMLFLTDRGRRALEGQEP